MSDSQSPPIALVTGAASGIGKELALQLAARDYTVVGVDYNAGALRALEEQLPNERRRRREERA